MDWKIKMDRPEWSEFWSLRLSNQKEIINYINWLEKEVKKLSHELDISKREIYVSKRKNHLIKLWAKGVLE